MNLATSTNIVFERADGTRIPMETSIRLCAEAGYKYLDLCFVDLIAVETPFSQENWRDYVKQLGALSHKLGVTFVQAHAPIHDFCNPYAPEEALEWVKRSIEGASMLGIKWIVIHPSTKVEDNKMSEKTHQENVAYFKKIATYAKQFNVGIAIENMWGKTKEGIKRYAIEAEELITLIQDIDCDNVGACWDTEHGAIENINQPEAIRLLGKYLKATHISDMTTAQHVHILPYVGFIEWTAIYEAFADIQYNEAFAFEMQHYLLRMPDVLIPQALKLSYDIGIYMIQQIK